jgi:hypothetical protein
MKHKFIKRIFGGLPVVDAKRELRVFLSSSDKDDAERKQPTRCAFAKACYRLYGSKRVAFFRTVVYVELPDDKGSHRIERFNPSKPTRNSIEKFDRTGKIDPGGYHLLPPSPGFTMDHRLMIDREYRARTLTSALKRKPARKRRIIVEVRNGKGLVKFIGGEKNWIRSA